MQLSYINSANTSLHYFVPSPLFCFSSSNHSSSLTPFFSSTAGCEAHRGGECAGSEGGAIHYTSEPVYPQHQGGLPAECHLWVQTSDQEATHVHVLCDAHTAPTVSKVNTWSNYPLCYVQAKKKNNSDFYPGFQNTGRKKHYCVYRQRLYDLVFSIEEVKPHWS